MVHAINATCVFLLAIFCVTLYKPYDAITMIEIKNGNMYLSSERSLAIMSVAIKVLTNQISKNDSGMQSLNFLIFWIAYIIPTKKKMVNGMLELVRGLFQPNLKVELGYAPGIMCSIGLGNRV